MNKHRGQLQIAETLVSVALMLVLALLLIGATNQTLSSYSNLTGLDQTATDILAASDEAGLLRPVIYLYGDTRYEQEFLSYKNLLNEYITTIVSKNIDYALIAHEIVNGTINEDFFSVIGSSTALVALQQGGKGVVANYHLGSFTSATFGQYTTQYLVQLYLWEKF
ncbi:MAG: hypothetical protein JSW11_06665 [Candidatus Heimdallarchaeota archaeon]|nr:MAG: hypothetical protein JSW11_06665 [Candidatus Heimdallarchaeota archaeon]